jgi:hypothetical protein
VELVVGDFEFGRDGGPGRTGGAEFGGAVQEQEFFGNEARHGSPGKCGHPPDTGGEMGELGGGREVRASD